MGGSLCKSFVPDPLQSVIPLFVDTLETKLVAVDYDDLSKKALFMLEDKWLDLAVWIFPDEMLILFESRYELKIKLDSPASPTHVAITNPFKSKTYAILVNGIIVVTEGKKLFFEELSTFIDTVEFSHKLEFAGKITAISAHPSIPGVLIGFDDGRVQELSLLGSQNITDPSTDEISSFDEPILKIKCSPHENKILTSAGNEHTIDLQFIEPPQTAREWKTDFYSPSENTFLILECSVYENANLRPLLNKLVPKIKDPLGYVFIKNETIDEYKLVQYIATYSGLIKSNIQIDFQLPSDFEVSAVTVSKQEGYAFCWNFIFGSINGGLLCRRVQFTSTNNQSSNNNKKSTGAFTVQQNPWNLLMTESVHKDHKIDKISMFPTEGIIIAFTSKEITRWNSASSVISISKLVKNETQILSVETNFMLYKEISGEIFACKYTSDIWKFETELNKFVLYKKSAENFGDHVISFDYLKAKDTMVYLLTHSRLVIGDKIFQLEASSLDIRLNQTTIQIFQIDGHFMCMIAGREYLGYFYIGKDLSKITDPLKPIFIKTIEDPFVLGYASDYSIFYLYSDPVKGRFPSYLPFKSQQSEIKQETEDLMKSIPGWIKEESASVSSYCRIHYSPKLNVKKAMKGFTNTAQRLLSVPTNTAKNALLNLTGGVVSAVSEATDVLMQNVEKLAEIQEKTDQMETDANDFANLAKQLEKRFN
jgi:hypothetical protein